MDLFSEQELTHYLENIYSLVKIEIDGDPENYILNVNETDYIEHLRSVYSVNNIEFHKDAIYASSEEADIPANLFPPGFSVRMGKHYKKNVIKYHLPYSGNAILLGCLPNPHLAWSIPVHIENSEVQFDIINFNDDANEIKNKREQCYFEYSSTSIKYCCSS